MWIIVSREYNDDPVFRSMAPLTTFSSRRRTILVFFNPGGGKPVERLSIGRFDYDGLFTVVQTHNDAQYEGLRKVVEERDPQGHRHQRVGRLESRRRADRQREATADGRARTEVRGAHEVRRDARRRLARDQAARGARRLSPRDEGRAPGDPRGVLEQGHHAGQDDQRGRRLVDAAARRRDGPRQVVPSVGHDSSPGRRRSPASSVIQRGDMLHTDFGLVYLGFSTDTQHNAYVLKPGETDAPQGLKDGLKAANTLQDLTMKFARGRRDRQRGAARRARRGHEGRASCRRSTATPSAITATRAGPPIGMTDYQEGVPVRGDYTFCPYTWHSIELNATHKVPEWGGQAVRFALEEDAAIMPDGKWDWIDGRQTTFYLIK